MSFHGYNMKSHNRSLAESRHRDAHDKNVLLPIVRAAKCKTVDDVRAALDAVKPIYVPTWWDDSDEPKTNFVMPSDLSLAILLRESKHVRTRSRR